MNSAEVAFGKYLTTSFGTLTDASVPPVFIFGREGNAEVYCPAVARL